MSDATILLIHGLGGNAHVWSGVREHLAGREVVALDLAGHGEGRRLARYDVGGMTADLASQLDPTRRYAVLGHSLGGVIALALGSGWFGIEVERVVGVGIKVAWTDTEREFVAALAAKPVAWFDTREAALERFLKVAGLAGLVPADAAVAEAGVIEIEGRWRMTVDPATPGVGAPDMVGLLAACRAEVVLARGELDPMVTEADLDALVPSHVTLAGLGHNPHVESPEAVAALLR